MNRNSCCLLLLTVYAAGFLYAAEPVAAVRSEADLQKSLDMIHDDIAAAEGTYLNQLTSKNVQSESVAQKLAKGDFYYNKKDYVSAGNIFYSIFSGREKKDFIWEEALFKLSESLYLNNNYISAARYYEILLTEMPNSRFQVQALKRLISTAYQLGEYSKAKNYYAEFTGIGYDIAKDQELVYFLAKALFFDKQYDDAEKIFQTVKPNTTYYMQALYISGVINIAKNKYDIAEGYFKKAVALASDGLYFKYEEMKNLSLLALGRLQFEKGDYPGAMDSYLNIDRKSKYFAEAYYELCWTYIRREQYEKALDALRLIKYIDPSSVITPKAKILEGNILIKLRKYAEAIVLFDELVGEYALVKDQLNVLKQDSSTVIDGKFDDSFSLMTPIARSLLRDDRKQEYATKIMEDIKSLQAELDQIDKIDQKLSVLMNNKNISAVFPPLKKGSERAIALKNKLISVRENWLAFALKGASLMNAADRKRYEELEREKNKLKQEAGVILPTTEQDVEDRSAFDIRKMLDFEAEVHRTYIQTKGYEEQIAFVRQYIAKQAQAAGKDDKLKKLDPKIEAEQKNILEFLDYLAVLKKDIELEKNKVLVGGDSIARMIVQRDKLLALIVEQEELLSKYQSSSSISSRVEELSDRIDDFYKKLNASVTQLVGTIRDSYESEKIKIEEYKSQVISLKREIHETVFMAMTSNVKKVKNTLDEFVLQADMGIIDVAWERKEESSQNLNRFRLQMAKEIQQLYQNMESIE